jgi:hypothetical protein
MAKTKKLGWEDVLPAAEVAFSIWVGQPEIRWAKTAWRHIMKAGLANYANELEYCKACLRFLALADVYYDWCLIAWNEEYFDDEIMEAWEHFEIRPFRLGQLIGPNELIEGYYSQRDLVSSAIGALVGTSRREVVQAILSGFGDTPDLFISLYNSDKSKKEEMITENWELNHVEVGFSTAYGWIEEGCPPWRADSMG